MKLFEYLFGHINKYTLAKQKYVKKRVVKMVLIKRDKYNGNYYYEIQRSREQWNHDESIQAIRDKIRCYSFYGKFVYLENLVREYPEIYHLEAHTYESLNLI